MKLWALIFVSCFAACEHGATQSSNPSSAANKLSEIDSVATGSRCDVAEASDAAARFAPAAGMDGTTAVAKDAPAITGWATQVIDVDYGSNVDPQWMVPARALGPAEGNSTDVVSLGEGGIITLGFGQPISDGNGFDLCVFENSFSDTFLEFAYVEVASNAASFVQFASRSLVPDPVDSYGTIDPTLVDGLAGKYRQGFCTPFDLSELQDRPEVSDGSLDLSAIKYVRIRDIIGDGRDLDCANHPIFDPYPTTGGAGFDLDAIAVLGSER
jgi:hypothetical protein